MPRPRSVAIRHAPIVAALGLLVACTGTPSSTSAWQSSSDRALGELISGLGTARLAVVQENHDRNFHAYTVRTVTDAIESGSRELSTYLLGQPPDALHDSNRVVTAALHDAEALLVEVRVSLASPGLTSSSARELVGRIDDMRDRLDSLDSAVQKAPGSVRSG